MVHTQSQVPQPLGVIAAMPVEGEAIESALSEPVALLVLGRRVISGLLEGHQVLLAYGGVGKVNAALAVAALANAGAAGVVMVGVAGAIAPGVGVGDAVVATDLVQHDVDVTAFNNPPGYFRAGLAGGSADPDLSDRLVMAARSIGAVVHRGCIASGDQFIASPEKSEAIADQFGAIAVEMEGAAAAHACRQIGLPLAVLRWISDAADDQAMIDFQEFLDQVTELDLKVVQALVAK